MSLQPLLIAPFVTGIDTDTESWISPPDSFDEADNVHIRHGYVEKRAGFRLFGDLKKTDVAVNISSITQAVNGVVTTGANHGLSTNDVVFITGVTGMTEVNNQLFTVTVLTLTTFELNEDTSTFGAYVAGGTVAKKLS